MHMYVNMYVYAHEQAALTRLYEFAKTDRITAPRVCQSHTNGIYIQLYRPAAVPRQVPQTL
jgi:hypothetical protein